MNWMDTEDNEDRDRIDRRFGRDRTQDHWRSGQHEGDLPRE